MEDYKLEKNRMLSEEEKDMLEDMLNSPVEYDDDCPPLTDAQLEDLKRIAEARREERRKQSVTLRLTPKALKKARSLGKGYTSVLSRILETALEDNDLIERFL